MTKRGLVGPFFYDCDRDICMMPSSSPRWALRPDTLALTAMLALLTALGPLSTDMYLPSLPAIMRLLDTTAAGAQLTLSSFLAGFAVGQIFYGPFSDRFGRKPVLLTGMALFILASVFCAIATSIEMLVIARFFQALGASGPIVLGRAIVRDLYEGPRAGQELSRMGTVMGVVPALAPIAGGLLETHLGWRSNFTVSALCGILLGLAVILMLPETVRVRSTMPLSLVSILRGFGVLLRNPVYRVYVALSACAYSGLFAFISGSSFVLQRIYGLTELQFGFAFSFCVLGFMTGTLIAQRVVRRRGIDGTIRIGVTCLALGGIGMVAAVMTGYGSPLEIMLPMTLYTCGVGMTMPQSMAGAMQPFPERAGAASSFLGLVQMTAAALVGAGLGHVLDRGTALPLPLTVAALGLTALIVFAVAKRRKPA
jgi:DHA1 family bicyclomycin/chloramphenicol resistance-like MFS transporter